MALALALAGGAAQLISSAPFGYLSDKWGRKTVYLMSCAGMAVAYLLLGLDAWMSVPLLFASRSLTGLSKHSGAPPFSPPRGRSDGI